MSDSQMFGLASACLGVFLFGFVIDRPGVAIAATVVLIASVATYAISSVLNDRTETTATTPATEPSKTLGTKQPPWVDPIPATVWWCAASRAARPEAWCKSPERNLDHHWCRWVQITASDPTEEMVDGS